MTSYEVIVVLNILIFLTEVKNNFQKIVRLSVSPWIWYAFYDWSELLINRLWNETKMKLFNDSEFSSTFKVLTHGIRRNLFMKGRKRTVCCLSPVRNVGLKILSPIERNSASASVKDSPSTLKANLTMTSVVNLFAICWNCARKFICVSNFNRDSHLLHKIHDYQPRSSFRDNFREFSTPSWHKSLKLWLCSARKVVKEFPSRFSKFHHVTKMDSQRWVDQSVRR